jgi:hypothetical protein
MAELYHLTIRGLKNGNTFFNILGLLVFGAGLLRMA